MQASCRPSTKRQSNEKKGQRTCAQLSSHSSFDGLFPRLLRVLPHFGIPLQTLERKVCEEKERVKKRGRKIVDFPPSFVTFPCAPLPTGGREWGEDCDGEKSTIYHCAMPENQNQGANPSEKGESAQRRRGTTEGPSRRLIEASWISQE